MAPREDAANGKIPLATRNRSGKCPLEATISITLVLYVLVPITVEALIEHARLQTDQAAQELLHRWCDVATAVLIASDIGKRICFS